MPPTSLLDTPPSLPSFGVITLPPSTTLSQFVSLQGSVVTTTIAVAVAFGVLICDYVHLFPHELKLYQTLGKALWTSPATWAFVVLRYSGILAFLPALFLTSIPNQHCQAVVVSNQVGVVLVVASSGLIFGSRVTAMWGEHKVIYAVIGIMYVAMIGCWSAVASQYRTESGPPAPFGSNCHMRPLVPWASTASASSVAFDVMILFLATFKLLNNSPSSSPGGYAIYRHSMVCFVITAVGNIAVLIIQALGPSFDHIKFTAAPISTLITAVAGARVYLHLQRQTRPEPVLPITSMRDSRSLDTFANPVTLPHSSSEATIPQSAVPKTYSIDFSSSDVPRADTPFASYDYDTPKDMTHFPRPVFTRETVVTVE